MSKTHEHTYVYTEPRLAMSRASRVLIRVIVALWYSLLTACTLVFLMSQERILIALGALIALFLVERLLHIGRAERSLAHFDALMHAGDAHTVNVAEYLAPSAYGVIAEAFSQAETLGGSVSLHLLRGLLKKKRIREVFVRLDASPEEVSEKLEGYLRAAEGEAASREALRETTGLLVVAAFKRAVNSYGDAVREKDLLGALADIEDKDIAKLLTLFDIKKEALGAAFLFGHGRKRRGFSFAVQRSSSRVRPMNRAWTAKPTPYLDRVSDDVTARIASSGAVMIGHNGEYDQLTNVLSRPGSPNALLIGEPGSGKDLLVEQLAFQITRDKVPSALFDKRLISLSISSLVSGAGATGAQANISKIIAEIEAAKNIILYIPDIHMLVKTGGGQSLSGADVLLPVIKSGHFSVIGSTYPQEYKKDIEPLRDFAGLFEPIRVEEISEGEAVSHLIYTALFLEKSEDVLISFKAITETVRLAKQYLHRTLLPGSAENLLKEVVGDVKQRGAREVHPDDVVRVAEMKTNVVLHEASADEAETLLNMEDEIHKTFINQDEAVTAVSNALRQYRSGVSRTGGPIASFLFVGPMGVGKTELSKTLARLQFGSADAMLRIDMSEYQEVASLARLIGAPDGSSRGNLTDAVLEKPYALLLLDEFEKAHPDIVNVFLQVLDDGRLTDGLGRTVDFTNTIIIATSNAHSTLIQEKLQGGMPVSELSALLKGRLTDFFKPELINRFSDVIVFTPLSQTDLEAVAQRNLRELADTVRETQGIDLVFEDGAVKEIAKRGYDPVFGARPLRKAISDELRAPLADAILKGEITKGGTVRVSYTDAEGFVFS